MVNIRHREYYSLNKALSSSWSSSPLILSDPGLAMRRYWAGLRLNLFKIGLMRRLIRFLVTAFLATFLETDIITRVFSLEVTLNEK